MAIFKNTLCNLCAQDALLGQKIHLKSYEQNFSKNYFTIIFYDVHFSLHNIL